MSMVPSVLTTGMLVKTTYSRGMRRNFVICVVVNSFSAKFLISYKSPAWIICKYGYKVKLVSIIRNLHMYGK